MNRNREEELHVPIGPDNNIEPGGPDRGQPTRLLPRRNRLVFRVQVPPDWGDRERVWTLTTKGQTERAYATLRLDDFVDSIVIASETGALGIGTSDPEARANQPPVIRIDGERRRTAKVGQPVELAAQVTDDGIPRIRRSTAARRPASGQGEASAAARRDPALIPPSRITVNKRIGLHVSWFVYRGEGRVRFEPMPIKPWEDTRAGANSPWAPLWTPPPVPSDGRWVAHATFQAPGPYVLRARADDGALFADDEITSTLNLHL